MRIGMEKKYQSYVIQIRSDMTLYNIILLVIRSKCTLQF